MHRHHRLWVAVRSSSDGQVAMTIVSSPAPSTGADRPGLVMGAVVFCDMGNGALSPGEHSRSNYIFNPLLNHVDVLSMCSII